MQIKLQITLIFNVQQKNRVNHATLSFYKFLIKILKVRIYLKIELKSNK